MRREEMRTHGVVEGDAVDDHELLQLVLVRRVVAVPTDHVEGRKVLGGTGGRGGVKEHRRRRLSNTQ